MISYRMTSWAIVCEVWYLPPMFREEGESAVEFANRVKAEIAHKGGLVDLDWDGGLKRSPAKKEWKEKQQLEISKKIIHNNNMSRKSSSSAINSDDQHSEDEHGSSSRGDIGKYPLSDDSGMGKGSLDFDDKSSRNSITDDETILMKLGKPPPPPPSLILPEEVPLQVKKEE
jgi:hypothetical protein